MNADTARTALSTISTGWTKSTFSNGGANGCVEFNFTVPGWAGVRDSKLGDASPVLVLNTTETDTLIASMKTGELDGRMR